jgi:hypothetical protein
MGVGAHLLWMPFKDVGTFLLTGSLGDSGNHWIVRLDSGMACLLVALAELTPGIFTLSSCCAAGTGTHEGGMWACRAAALLCLYGSAHH